jgi:hypothetical protein
VARLEHHLYFVTDGLESISLILLVPRAFVLGYIMGFDAVEFLAMGAGVLLLLLCCTLLVLLPSAVV